MTKKDQKEKIIKSEETKSESKVESETNKKIDSKLVEEEKQETLKKEADPDQLSTSEELEIAFLNKKSKVKDIDELEKELYEKNASLLESNGDLKKETELMSKKKKKFKWDFPNIVFITAACIILIPSIILAIVLLSARSSTGEVLTGDRFAGDLDPAITEEQISTIKNALTTNEKIEKIEINVKAATFRVSVDTVDQVSAEELVEIVSGVYTTVLENLPKEEYFTAVPGVKNQYDLEIHGYTSVSNEAEGRLYYVLYKNSLTDTENVQLISAPKDESYKKKLLELFEERLKAREAAENAEPTEPTEDIVAPDESEGEGNGD